MTARLSEVYSEAVIVNNSYKNLWDFQQFDSRRPDMNIYDKSKMQKTNSVKITNNVMPYDSRVDAE